VHKYKSAELTPEKMKEEAVKIFNSYIGPKARTPVNISGSLSEAIATKINSGDISQGMFREAAEQIFWLMKSDSFVRFQAWSEGS
jgi:hypothetical protein